MFFLGDYNLNCLDYQNNTKVRNFFDILFSYGMIPIINKPTRGRWKTWVRPWGHPYGFCHGFDLKFTDQNYYVQGTAKRKKVLYIKCRHSKALNLANFLSASEEEKKRSGRTNNRRICLKEGLNEISFLFFPRSIPTIFTQLSVDKALKCGT